MDSKQNSRGLTEQLSKLAKMHTDGVLTDEEFKALKTKLIAKSADYQVEQKARGKTQQHFTSTGSDNKGKRAKSISQTEPTATEQSPLVEGDLSTQSQLQEWWRKNPVLGWGVGVLILFVLGYFVFFSSGGTPDLRATKQTTGTQEESVTVTNIGQTPITIRGGSINGIKLKELKPVLEQITKENPRAVFPLSIFEIATGKYGCAFTVASGTWDSMLPVTLRVGQSVDFSFMTVCGTVVSAIFYTERGTASYSWK